MENDEAGAAMFGRWLDLTMGNRGITGRDLAKCLKVHDSAVSRWRSGFGAPSMDTCLRLAKALGVDEPIRLAVTAGLVDGRLISISPLPMPEPTAQRRAVKRQIKLIRGLTERERQTLLDTYDEIGEET